MPTLMANGFKLKIWFLAKLRYFKQFGGCKYYETELGIDNKLRFPMNKI